MIHGVATVGSYLQCFIVVEVLSYVQTESTDLALQLRQPK